ncbi:MAG: SpoIID/LytB domain-containing protein [Bacteroidota bacterium]
MVSKEPLITVGMFEHEPRVEGSFDGKFVVGNVFGVQGEFTASVEHGAVVLKNKTGKEIIRQKEFLCKPLEGLPFKLANVTIGVGFHWERRETQTFPGSLRLLAREDGTITAINEVGVEEYLKSVISSEMSAEAPIDLLKAHAITSRSWLVAMLEREKKNVGVPSQRSRQTAEEIVRWYDREDHALFDVCADDHCQRYQGLTKIISKAAAEAVEATRGTFLIHDNQVCDARFSKSCGGLSELFESCWEELSIPYLSSVSDSANHYAPVVTESRAAEWLHSSPDAYCNTADGKILKQVLPSFDQETTDFFRWTVVYNREALEELIKSKSGIDFGTILNLVPLQRGPSGRIFRLRIEGTKKTIVVGKELEIRRWLSKSHLYSSAFIVETEKDSQGTPTQFTLRGGGWGHGVGLCQIGAAVMAAKGFGAEEIVKHYFRGAELQKLY